jgi:hypothetical protein
MKHYEGLGVVLKDCSNVILPTQEAEISRIVVSCHPGKKSVRLHRNKNLRVVVHLCNPNYEEGIGSRITP